MTNKILDHRCDIEYKGQDQTYSIYALLLETQTPLSILMKVFFIFIEMIAYGM